MDVVREPLVVHGLTRGRADYGAQVAELLRMVGLVPSMRRRCPHEFSGGQHQRIGLARALVAKPAFLSSARNRSRPWMSPSRPRSSNSWKSANKR